MRRALHIFNQQGVERSTYREKYSFLFHRSDLILSVSSRGFQARSHYSLALKLVFVFPVSFLFFTEG